MTSQHSVVVVAPVRTAIGTFGGSLKEISAPNLGTIAVKAAVAQLPVDVVAPAVDVAGRKQRMQTHLR